MSQDHVMFHPLRTVRHSTQTGATRIVIRGELVDLVTRRHASPEDFGEEATRQARQSR